MNLPRFPRPALLALALIGAALGSPGHAPAQSIRSWGANDYGQLGDGTMTNRSAPVAVQTLTSGVTMASGGGFHGLAIRNGAVYAWGRDNYGQLGDNDDFSERTPVAVQTLTDGVTAVAGGGYHSLAIRNGAVYAWGDGANGQLGNGATTNNFTPGAVNTLTDGVTAVAGGGYHSLAIRNGAVYTWGANNYGQLGNGTTTVSLTPVAVSTLTSGVTAVAAGGYHSLAICNGAAYAWGRDDFGQLGNKKKTNNINSPVAVSTLTSGVTAVAAGTTHSLAVYNGAAYAWGHNDHGQLGNGKMTDSLTPIQVDAADLKGIVAVAAGTNSSYALASDGSLWVWGGNDSGQLGLGTSTANYLTPQHLLPPVGFVYTSISADNYFAQAILAPVVVVVHDFSAVDGKKHNTDGINPSGALIQGIDNNFYGTASAGGPNTFGTLFQLTPGDAFKPIYNFGSLAGGGNPQAALVQGNDGNFYGVSGNIFNNNGTVFAVTPAGALASAYDFTGGADGSVPLAGLILGNDGSFYGATAIGGNSTGNGTLFKITVDGKLTTLHQFNGGDGANPQSGVIQALDGNFYGTTAKGGARNKGTVFKMTPDGTVTTLYAFGTKTTDGSGAIGLVQGSDGNFYGTTQSGGTKGKGTVFVLTPDGKMLTTLHSFLDGADGANPTSSLIQGSDGSFYGTASNDLSGNGLGTLFMLSADSKTLTTLYDFSKLQGADGAYPVGGLVQGSDGLLYGTTQGGGDNNNGTVYQFNASQPNVVRFHALFNSAFESADTTQVRVDRIGGQDALSVSYQTQDDTAVAGTDYTATSGTLSWPAGDQAPKFVSVPVTNRGFTDGSLRSLSLTLTRVGSDSTDHAALGFPSTARLTINGSSPGTAVITSATTASGTVGKAFSYRITATPTPTSYGVANLPGGLTVDTKSGLISGTPTTEGTFKPLLKAFNARGAGVATLTLAIAPTTPVITSATTATATAEKAFSYQITAANSPASYDATGLPAGLSVDTKTGLISGTPTAVGKSTITLQATNVTGTGTATLTLTITPPTPAITSAATASATTGKAFSYQITASHSPTSYGATGLPAGLSVDAKSGLISGTPTAVGTFSVTLQATNVNGTGTATLTLTITPPPPAINSATTAKANVSTMFTYQITATNNPTGYDATGLPAGLSVDTKSGLISGTPTTMGTAMVTLQATNAGGTGTATLTLTVARALPVITSAKAASGNVGKAFSYRITATNTPTSYGATGLPAGLTLKTDTGVISGMPTAAGKSTVTLSATNDGGTGTGTLTLTVAQAAPAITSATTASATQGAAFKYQITATNSPTSYGVAGLPAGLTVDTATGLISGAPTATGQKTLTVQATNAQGTGTAKLTLTIAPAAPTITSVTTATATIGKAFSYQIMANNGPTSYGATGLPAGLSVDMATGLISGTPSVSGQQSVTLQATNAIGTGTATLSLYVNTAAAPVITSATTATANLHEAFSYQITATGSPYSYGAAGVPAGLTVDKDTGLISGTPTVAGQRTLVIQATSKDGTGKQTLTLTVAQAVPVITSATTASANVGKAFSYQITASNGPTGYSVVGLPAGLTVNKGTGLISGTPTAAGTFTPTLQAINGGGTGTGKLTLTIAQAAPVITSPATATATVGVAFRYQITATNDPTAYSVLSLPAGLTVNKDTGLISGTLTTAGQRTPTLQAVNGGGTGKQTLTLTVNP